MEISMELLIGLGIGFIIGSLIFVFILKIIDYFTGYPKYGTNYKSYRKSHSYDKDYYK